MDAYTGLPYAVVENNGGMLTLFIFDRADRDTAVYAYTGLEFDTPEIVAEIVRALDAGHNPLDGNADDVAVADDPQTWWLEVDLSDVVLDDGGLYPARMGEAAGNALRVLLYAESLDNVRRWDGGSVFHLEDLMFEARQHAPEAEGKPDTSALDEVVLELAKHDRNNTWPDWSNLIAVDESGYYLGWSDSDWVSVGYLPDDRDECAAA